MLISSPLQGRRNDEVTRRIEDFGRRVKRGLLVVFTQAHAPTEVTGTGSYMARSSAEQYLKACGFQVLGADASVQLKPSNLLPAAQDKVEAGVNNRTLLAREVSSSDKPPSRNQAKRTSTATVIPDSGPRAPLVGQRDHVRSRHTGSKVLRLGEALARTGLGRTSFYNRINPLHRDFDPTFPKRVEIGRRARGFLEQEVDEWISQQTKKRH